MPSGHGGSVIKLKSFWCRAYYGQSKPSNYAKRIVMIDHQLGDMDHHLARYMDLLAQERAAQKAA